MKVSLVMPTINVENELIIFLESLKNQTYKNFELIVVDQNENDNIFLILEKYEKDFEIVYIKSGEKGLSLNRNKALIMSKGDVFAFPDDDCEYEKDTIEKTVNFFKNNKDKRIYSCRTLEKGKDYGTGVMLDYSTEITKKNVLETIKSITFFVNFLNDDITLFDEKLGVGSKFGSGEESDYILRLLHKGYKGYYYHSDIIYHPAKKGNYDDIERAKNYGRGYGALMKKEIIYRKNYSYLIIFLKRMYRNLGGLFISKNRKYHFNVILSRLEGFFKYKQNR